MTALQFANVLQAVAIAALLSIVCFKLMAVYRLDAFRQQMFSLRDELFDYAADGNIGFRDPAYVILRESMNSLIRYGHQITVFRLVVSRFIPASMMMQSRPWNQLWNDAVSKIPDEKTQQALTKFHEQAQFLTVRRLISGSPALTAVLMCAGAVYFLKTGVTSLRQIQKAAARKILIGPIDPRRIEEQAVCASA